MIYKIHNMNYLFLDIAKSPAYEKIKGTARKHPECLLCKNHGLVRRKLGHKGFCQYENCNCSKCTIDHSYMMVKAFNMAMWRENQKINKPEPFSFKIGNINLFF